MTIDKNKVVSISYELRVNAKDGDLVEKVEATKPMEYLHGVGGMLESFEEKLAGLKADDTFDFMLKTTEAYGEASETAVMDVPKTVFEVDGKIDENLLKIDNVIPMQDKEGNSYNGIVLEIADETVKIDFNHPLAGDDLFFTGTVLTVREATETEISHGHIHSGGHHHEEDHECNNDGGCGCGN